MKAEPAEVAHKPEVAAVYSSAAVQIPAEGSSDTAAAAVEDSLEAAVHSLDHSRLHPGQTGRQPASAAAAIPEVAEQAADRAAAVVAATVREPVVEEVGAAVPPAESTPVPVAEQPPSQCNWDTRYMKAGLRTRISGRSS